ncbi:MAG TPA: electron transfer flavoprotein subunit beta/FixA family protein [Acidimicrobiales bacterium]|nr:electron transfer flavoprotein subunit beta/FixA family protein [Acidimicrobiales bacterium]
MKVVACVKCVPEGRARLDPSSMRLEREGAAEINAFDLFAVEEAIRIKESNGAEVVVVSVGPGPAEEALRSALALGADRAVLVNDASAAGSDMVATARILAKALEREGADLVLFGQQTSDGGGAVLWAAVADLLRLPVVSQTTSLELADRSVRAVRQSEGGDDVVEAPLPAVVAVTDAINELRYASLKGKMAAKKKPLDALALSDLGLGPDDAGARGSRTDVLRISGPPSRPDAFRIEEPDRAPQVIVDFLAERQLV